MSGAHALYRTPSVPLVVGGETIDKSTNNPMDWNVIRRVVKPVPEQRGRHNKNITEWELMVELRPTHVLSFVNPEIRPSKHRKGRMRRRTRAEQSRFRALQARVIQAHKSATIDISRLREVFDETAAAEAR